jgi:hypothetical protein
MNVMEGLTCSMLYVTFKIPGWLGGKINRRLQ